MWCCDAGIIWNDGGAVACVACVAVSVACVAVSVAVGVAVGVAVWMGMF